MPHMYQVYGLTVLSESAIPYFVKSSVKGKVYDVAISFEPPLDRIAAEGGWVQTHPGLNSAPNGSSSSVQVWDSEQWLRLSYTKEPNEKLDFYISKDGKQLYSDKAESIPTSDAKSFVLGSTFGCLLRVLNKTCLHASVLSYNDRSFAIMGDKGAGKSTTTAALLEAGAKLISDDVAVLDFDRELIRAEAGYPAVRLLPSALQAYTDNLQQFQPVLSVGDKKFVPLPNTQMSWEFDSRKLPLSCIYSLGSRKPLANNTELNHLSFAEALLALAPHSYTAYMLSREQKKQEFKRIVQVARQIPVKSLTCVEDLSALPSIASEIIKDFSITL